MWWFDFLKWAHVMAAVVAVGANLTYSVWIRRAARERPMLPFVLENIARIDRRIANPGYIVSGATGLTMALALRLPLGTPWLLSAVILYALAALLGIAVYAPLARRQRKLLRTEGFDSPAYQAAARRADLMGGLVTVDVVVIIFLMVVKPPLWA